MAFLLSKLGFWGLIGSVVASGAIIVTALNTILDDSSNVDKGQVLDTSSSEEAQPEEETQPEEEAQPEEEMQPEEEAQPEEEVSGNDTSVLRVDSEGNALLAGKVEPNSKVKIVVGEEVLGETTSDSSGDYVVIGKIKSDEDTQELRIATKPNSKTENDIGSLKEDSKSTVENEWVLTQEIYIILPTQVKVKELEKYASNAEVDALEEPLPLILRSDQDEIKIVQNRNNSSVDKITIDLISYSEDGEVKLTGRSNSNSRINIYLNNELRYYTDAGIGGSWEITLINLAPKVYTLRLDEVNTLEGRVISRLLTPFKKIRLSALDNITERSITVMPGNSLWRIARKIYGRGIQYVEIYEENKSLIKDPDLIYPGQIFNLPDG